MRETDLEKPDKEYAAVCGLYCESCSWFIATMEDPDRLKRLQAQSSFADEKTECYGCRSNRRIPYCTECKMFACAAERGIDFCSQCEAYPCDTLKQFQSAMPHRIELWENLEHVKSAGYENWLREIRKHYTCPQCGTINSAYDIKCRNCGAEPSCSYVAKHKQEIKRYLEHQ